MSSPTLPRFQFSATYPEPALLAIARSAAATGRLDRLYTTLVGGPGTETWARRLPVPSLRASLGRELDRRRLDGIPRETVVTLARGRDVAHRMATQMPASDRLVPALEHRLKTDFDSRVSARVDGAPGDLIFAMEEAAELTIEAAHRRGMRVVLHVVNGHPTEKNRYLAELGNLPVSHPEMVPATVVGRIQRELAAADIVLVPSEMVAEQMVRSGAEPGQASGVEIWRRRRLPQTGPEFPGRERAAYLPLRGPGLPPEGNRGAGPGVAEPGRRGGCASCLPARAATGSCSATCRRTRRGLDPCRGRGWQS